MYMIETQCDVALLKCIFNSSSHCIWLKHNVTSLCWSVSLTLVVNV